jgi:MFS family permease
MDEAPDGGRLYYGWIIVAVMSLAGAVTMAMGTLNLGLFVKPMGDELGISRATFGWALSLRQFALASTSPPLGLLIDRFGVRWLLALSAGVTGTCVAGLSAIDGGGQMVALFIVIGLVGWASPGALMTSVPLMKWFVRDRGRAVAMMSIGVPIGALIFLPLTQVWIDLWGWRATWLALGVLGAVVVAPLSIAFVRRQPEDLGLRVDGEPPPTAGVSLVDERSWTPGEARRTAAFWVLTAVFSLLMLAVGTLAMHRIVSFLDRGIDPSLVALATAFDAVMAGVSTFAMGWLAGTVRSQLLGAAGFLLLAVASVLTILTDEPLAMFASMGLFGLGIGGMMFLQNVIWAEFFGRVHLGAIRGFTQPITMTIGGAGAPLAGYVRDVGGSYEPIWWASAAVMALGAVAVLFARPPAPPSDHAEA